LSSDETPTSHSKEPNKRSASSHPRRGFAHVCWGLYVCTFWDYVKRSLSVWCALHCTNWLLLGHSLNWRRGRAQLFVTERTGGYNTFTLGWAAQCFSPGSVGCIDPRSVFLFWSVILWFESTKPKLAGASEKGLGDCVHFRDMVLTRASMTYVVRALFDNLQLVKWLDSCTIFKGAPQATRPARRVFTAYSISREFGFNTWISHNFFEFFCSTLWDFRNARTFSQNMFNPQSHVCIFICPCSWAVGISKKIWIQTYFGPVMVVSVEIFRQFVFWRHRKRLASFFIVKPGNFVFRKSTIFFFVVIKPENPYFASHLGLEVTSWEYIHSGSVALPAVLSKVHHRPEPLVFMDSCPSFFVSLFSKTQPNHWTKRMASTRLATYDPRTCPGPEDRSIT